MTNPIIANISPPVLSWLLLILFKFNNIFFIFEGNKAYTIPSIKRNNPKAIISSFIFQIIYCDLEFVFPKNLKNSLSGDKIKDVSPPIKAVSYACIAL